MFNLSLAGLGIAAILALPSWAADSRHYEVGSYDRIYLHGNAHLRLTQASEPQQDAHATGSAAQLDDLTFESSDGVLYIEAPDSYRGSDLVINIAVHQLKEVVAEGDGRVFADGIRQPSLALEGRGHGSFSIKQLHVNDLMVVGEGRTRFQVSGEATHQTIDLAGAGSYQASGLSSQTSQVTVRGAGQIDLWVDDLLDVDVSGAAVVRYSGTPWVQKHISGAGAVSRLR